MNQSGAAPGKPLVFEFEGVSEGLLETPGKLHRGPAGPGGDPWQVSPPTLEPRGSKQPVLRFLTAVVDLLGNEVLFRLTISSSTALACE